MVDSEYNLDKYKSLKIGIRAMIEKSRNAKNCSSSPLNKKWWWNINVCS